MVADLTPGANIALPSAAVEVGLRGPFDLSALVVNGNGKVAGDADMVFYNAPSAQGVQLRDGTITVTPGRLRRGAAKVVVVASPEREGTTFAALPPPHATLADARGRAFARIVAPALRTETVLLLAEVYERGGGWRVRAVGQGYADGLAGLARDFGVVVDDAPSDIVLEVVTATNVERARHRLRPLTVDAQLTAAAQAHTEDMVRRGFFAHENPDGKQVRDRALAAGYAYRKLAENIAAGQRTAAEVVQGWMDSPGHRQNILDGDLTQIGVGHAPGGSYDVYWTQVFGTPR